jgi:MFS family permease
LPPNVLKVAIGELVKRHLIDIRPLAEPAFRRIWTGQGIAHIGIGVTVVAVSKQVWDLTHSSLWVGVLGLAYLLPLLLFGLWGGAFADAVDRRKLLIISSLVSWGATLFILAQALLGLGNVYLLLLATAVSATGSAMSSPARGAIIPRLVPVELVPAANALNSLAYGFGAIAGPMIAGVFLAWQGYALAYAVDAVLFTAGLYAAIRLPALPPMGESQRAGWRSVVEGLRYIATRPVLLMSFVVDIIAMVFALPRALIPQVVSERFGDDPRALGWLSAGMAIGAVLGALGSGWVGRVRRQGLALTFTIAVWGLSVAASGLAHQVWLMVVLFAVGGVADMLSSVWRQSILQLNAPDEMRGRMQGAFMVVVAGGPRLGDLRAGATAVLFGMTTAWVGGGLACAVAVLVVGLSVSSFRTYRSGEAVPA